MMGLISFMLYASGYYNDNTALVENLYRVGSVHYWRKLILIQD